MNKRKDKQCGRTILLVSLGLIFCDINPSISVPDTMTADAIIKAYTHNRQISRVENLIVLTYDAAAKKTTGGLKLKHYAKTAAASGDYMRMIVVVAPVPIRGVKMLVLERANGSNEIWLYSPAETKTRQLSESEKNGKFMNTEFTFADILLPMSGDYTHSLLRSVKYNGWDCFVIESVPAGYMARKEMGIGRILNWVRKEDFVGLKTAYYDTNRHCVRTIRRSRLVEFDPVNHRYIPLKSVIVNEQTKMKTIVESRIISFSTRIPDTWFTVEQMEKE